MNKMLGVIFLAAITVIGCGVASVVEAKDINDLFAECKQKIVLAVQKYEAAIEDRESLSKEREKDRYLREADKCLSQLSETLDFLKGELEKNELTSSHLKEKD